MSETESDYYSDSSESSYATSSSSDESSVDIENMEKKFTNEPILGKYHLVYLIASSSTSNVWLSYNNETKEFDAIKILHPKYYKDGKYEVGIMKRMSKSSKLLRLKTYFTKKEKGDTYLCMVYELYCGSLDDFIRKGDYKEGFRIDVVKTIFRQIVEGLRLLHKKDKIVHCDMKTDNILVRGHNERSKRIIELYKNMDFEKMYKKEKEHVWKEMGNNVKDINKMTKKLKATCKLNVHRLMMTNIEDTIEKENVDKNKFDKSILNNISVSIADFGSSCTDDETYDDDFGTVYYRAPEIILRGETTSKVDIWALGCILYELVTGDIMFNPNKDRYYTRDQYHLRDMYELCGDFPESFIKKTRRKKEFFNKKNKLSYVDQDEITKINFDELYPNVKSDRIHLLDLTKKLLSLDPKKRPCCSDILSHPFLVV